MYLYYLIYIICIYIIYYIFIYIICIYIVTCIILFIIFIKRRSCDVDRVTSEPSSSGLCDWPRQEAEAVHPLPGHHGEELRRAAPSYRLSAAHCAEEGGHARQLEGKRLKNDQC